jgi:hypothetical protein
MARTKISEFSATAAENTDIDNIDIAEGCAPSGINNAIRELMAQLKDMQTGASGDAFTLTTVNSTTVDTTNLEVSNLKAKDGTAAGSIANSTGVVTLASTVLTTTDINGGTVDGTTIGASTPSTVRATQVDIIAQGDLRLQDTTGGEFVALQAPAALSSSYTLTLPVDDGTSGQALITDGLGVLSWSSAAAGDVYGPASATNNAISIFDGTTGKLLKNTGITIDGSNNVSGVTQLNAATVAGTTLTGTTANVTNVNATTLNSTNLEVTNLKAKDGTAAGSIAVSTGVVTLASAVLTTAAVNGGNINNTVIGATTRAAGNFTTLNANGNVTLGDATADTITATGRFNTDLVPSTDNVRDLGTAALKWKQIYATTFTENTFPVVVQSDIGTAPNEIPLNQYLGNMAFMSSDQVVLNPAASAVPSGIGDMVFQLSSDTSLVVKVKGSDGTIRSATLTLA